MDEWDNVKLLDYSKTYHIFVRMATSQKLSWVSGPSYPIVVRKGQSVQANIQRTPGH